MQTSLLPHVGLYSLYCHPGYLYATIACFKYLRSCLVFTRLLMMTVLSSRVPLCYIHLIKLSSSEQQCSDATWLVPAVLASAALAWQHGQQTGPDYWGPVGRLLPLGLMPAALQRFWLLGWGPAALCLLLQHNQSINLHFLSEDVKFEWYKTFNAVAHAHTESQDVHDYIGRASR